MQSCFFFFFNHLLQLSVCPQKECLGHVSDKLQGWHSLQLTCSHQALGGFSTPHVHIPWAPSPTGEGLSLHFGALPSVPVVTFHVVSDSSPALVWNRRGMPSEWRRESEHLEGMKQHTCNNQERGNLGSSQAGASQRGPPPASSLLPNPHSCPSPLPVMPGYRLTVFLPYSVGLEPPSLSSREIHSLTLAGIQPPRIWFVHKQHAGPEETHTRTHTVHVPESGYFF